MLDEFRILGPLATVGDAVIAHFSDPARAATGYVSMCIMHDWPPGYLGVPIDKDVLYISDDIYQEVAQMYAGDPKLIQTPNAN